MYIIEQQRKRELKMKRFSSYRSYSSSYRPYGSDDGYDYHRDNRDGSVDDYIEYVEQLRKEQEKKKVDSPKSGD
jgi:hypothetical protein